MSAHIPADWSGAYHVTMRLAENQGGGQNGLLNYGQDELRLKHQRHDLDVSYRVYAGAGGQDHLAIMIYNHAENGENLRLYAEMYLDNSPDPIYVDLPYYPEYTAVGMTHTLDMPVSALLDGRAAQKVELRILAAGVDEPVLRNNQFTFYVTDYTDTLRFLYQPVDTAVYPGGTAEFSVEAAGGLLPYTYQWEVYMGPYLGWQTIPDATESVLRLPEAGEAMDGRKYRCRVTDHNLDKIVSDEATLRVLELPPTGDSSSAALYLALAVGLFAGWLALRARARKRRNEP